MIRSVIFGLVLFALNDSFGSTWENAKQSGNAELDLVWYTSRPFISQTNDGEVTGIEYEMMLGFKGFLKTRYNVDLELNWIEGENFPWIFDHVKDHRKPNVFGISAYSITDARAQSVKFTDSYMPDVTVLVSSQGTPIVDSFNEIDEFMKDMEAVTIKGTTYEGMLQDLKTQLNIDFKVKYIDSGENILEHIRQASNRFGFIDLPIYLMLIKNGEEVTRQNFFTLRGKGYGIIMPLHSDWDKPFNEFLSDPEHAPLIAKSISKHLGTELYEFMDNIYNMEQLGTSILTKEKEIQLALIKNANLKLQEDEATQKFLIWGIAVSLIFIVIIGFLYIKNNKTTRILKSQKDKIEHQQRDIRRKNEQLTNRNRQLVEINKEKNNLVNILAHDLRSPLGQVIGLAGALRARIPDMDLDDKELLLKIGEGAERMNHMIDKMLDENSLEGNKSNVLIEEVNIHQLMLDISSRYTPLALNKSIKLEFDHCDENYLGSTDHLLLLQVLENLVSNAIKFSPENSTVTVLAECTEDKMLFKICDQGPGFTEEDKTLIFGRYQRLSAKPTGSETSTGLGLSIVKKYVQQLGGAVWVYSEPGGGSTFNVSLPVKG